MENIESEFIERVGNQKVKRKKGYLYYVGKDGYVYEIPENGKGDGVRVTNAKIERKDGYLYYVDEEGYVVRAKLFRPEEYEKRLKVSLRVRVNLQHL